MQLKTKFRYSLMIFFVIFLSFVTNCRAQAATSSEIDAIKEKVIETYGKYQTEVDVSTYNLYHDADAAATTQLMTDVLTQTPGLFYSGLTYQKIIISHTNQVKKLVLTYDDAYLTSTGEVNVSKIQKTQKKIDQAVNTALKSVNSKMSKLEKAMVLHDYLVLNTAYNNSTGNNNRLTEVGAFLKGKANCQGYSIAYALLMKKIGVPVRFVTSENMGHIWNMIKLGGKWYHVDVTWDDPVEINAREDQYGLVRHDYFLCSTKKMRKQNYYGFSASAASAVKYDNAWWKKVSSAIHYRSGKWIILNNKGIVRRNSLTGGKTKLLKKLSGKTLIRMNSNKYYLITQNSVYLYDYPGNSLRCVWNPRKKYGASYYLTQIKYENSRIYYKVLKGKKHKKGSFKVKASGLAA